MTPPSTLEAFPDWFPYQELTYEWDGTQVIALVGGTLRHNTIANRLANALDARLQGGPCTVFRADVQVRTAAASRIRYPDLVVTCSPPSTAGTTRCPIPSSSSKSCRTAPPPRTAASSAWSMRACQAFAAT
ncbi:Uma2 family endonuclease [Roseomonas sp. CCTCC AB2023176]|uniref:Uma2 family endonuclease n=1 Tax=Roseomonas sp. CCTCC AB2023176 TaxID=3342640 RepID=UPI0035D66F5B